MRRALKLALRGPADNDNPQVGCVILDSTGLAVAEGWHDGAGSPHAEVMALRALANSGFDDLGLDASTLTAVVTLEPCNHTGRTGPCAEALIARGIGSVVYGLSDPGSSSGGGRETLRAAGVNVTGGVLADEVSALLAPWLVRKGIAETGAAVA